MLDQAYSLIHAAGGVTSLPPTLDGMPDAVRLALVGCVMTFVALAMVDLLVVRPLLPRNAGWFLLHVGFNAWLTWIVWNDAMDVLYNPERAMLDRYCPAAVVTTGGISGLHIYHAVAFPMTQEDWIHHILNCLFVPAVGVAAPFGNSVAFCNLGMCGVPGGIDYLLLAGVKLKLVDRMFEKWVNRYLNLLLRWPMMFLSSYFVALNIMKGQCAPGVSTATKALMFVAVVAHFANAAFYCDKVIGNFHVTSTRKSNEHKKEEAQETKHANGKSA